MRSDNFFSIFHLPISLNINKNLLDKAYFEYQKKLHPDIANPLQHQEISIINNAYNTLNHDFLRVEYVANLYEDFLNFCCLEGGEFFENCIIADEENSNFADENFLNTTKKINGKFEKDGKIVIDEELVGNAKLAGLAKLTMAGNCTKGQKGKTDGRLKNLRKEGENIRGKIDQAVSKMAIEMFKINEEYYASMDKEYYLSTVRNVGCRLLNELQEGTDKVDAEGFFVQDLSKIILLKGSGGLDEARNELEKKFDLRLLEYLNFFIQSAKKIKFYQNFILKMRI